MSSKKKGNKYNLDKSRDVTINDFANAAIVSNRPKKSTKVVDEALVDSWDELGDVNFDVLDINEDGTNQIIVKQKRKVKTEYDAAIEDGNGQEYPEIVWYLVSRFINPEDVGRFASINKTTYFITKTESFWKILYKSYCKNNHTLPNKLRLENMSSLRGLRQIVIRSLFFSHHLFVNRIEGLKSTPYPPHALIKRKCVSMWFHKYKEQWIFYFKLKSCSTEVGGQSEVGENDIDYLLKDIDANKDDNCKVLQVICESCHPVPLIMGMTLSTVSIFLAQGFQQYKVHLGFNYSKHNVRKTTLPECSLTLDTAKNITVLDWWHPFYPHLDNSIHLPYNWNDEERPPILKKDFLSEDTFKNELVNKNQQTLC